MKNKTNGSIKPGNIGIEDGVSRLLNSGAKFVIEKVGKTAIKPVVRFCRQDDLDDILALQKRVYDCISDKETFVWTTAEELAESLELDVCIGVYHYGGLIAFTLMVTSPNSTRNLGLYLDRTPEECLRCVTYDTTFVDPAYTGYGLQRVLIRLKDRLALERGAEEALATVSPNNTCSLRNLELSGFTVVERKKMYGEFIRLILRKQLKKHGN